MFVLNVLAFVFIDLQIRPILQSLAPDVRLRYAGLGGAVFSHFVLDVPMRTPDMPLWPGAGAPKIGLGLWNHRFLSILAELGVLAAGGALYLRASRARSRFARIGTGAFAVFLVGMTISTPFQPNPKSAAAFAAAALAATSGSRSSRVSSIAGGR